MGRLREALSDYNTVLQQDAASAHAYHNRGMLYDKMGMIDQAIADFSKVLELEPQGQGQGQNDGGNNNFSQQQPLSNRQAAQLALEALQQQLNEKNLAHSTGSTTGTTAGTIAGPSTGAGPSPPAVALGRQSNDASLIRLLSAQALLSQAPAISTSSRPPDRKPSRFLPLPAPFRRKTVPFTLLVGV